MLGLVLVHCISAIAENAAVSPDDDFVTGLDGLACVRSHFTDMVLHARSRVRPRCAKKVPETIFQRRFVTPVSASGLNGTRKGFVHLVTDPKVLF